MKIAYCSDKYQYTMGKTFVDAGLDTKKAVFNMFYRTAPDNNNWAVVSGVNEVLEMAGSLGSQPESFFRKFLPEDMYEDFCKKLTGVRFTGDIYAMEEGQIVFPKQPIITVVAPLLQAQILETPLLTIMNHQMAVATKASRVTRSTDKPVSEFGSRRAHGPWAALHVHSEFEAFDMYIKSHRGEGLILLVDTYDTLKSGIVNAIAAFKANNIDNNYKPFYGIRLDSGDLAYLSRECRGILDREGLSKCVIFASNALDEYLISDLERQNAAIDFYGVGDAIATSKHNPCFGNVYKLVQMEDNPVLKVSDDKAKVINPGFQVTYRIYQNNESKADVTCLRGDNLATAIEKGSEILLRDEYDRTKKTRYSEGTYTAEVLQQKVVENGVRVVPDNTQQQKQDRYLYELSRMNPTERRIINPHYHKVDISDDLYDLKMGLIYKIKEELNHV